MALSMILNIAWQDRKIWIRFFWQMPLARAPSQSCRWASQPAENCPIATSNVATSLFWPKSYTEFDFSLVLYNDHSHLPQHPAANQTPDRHPYMVLCSALQEHVAGTGVAPRPILA